MKIKDLPVTASLDKIHFKVPKGHPECPIKTAYWVSQWGYKDGKAGVWCKEKLTDTQVYPIFLDKLTDAMEFEIIKS